MPTVNNKVFENEADATDYERAEHIAALRFRQLQGHRVHAEELREKYFDIKQKLDIAERDECTARAIYLHAVEVVEATQAKAIGVSYEAGN